MSEAIGYNILKVKLGMFDMVGVPFGIRNENGQVDSLAVKAVDEIYRSIMEVEEDDGIQYYTYELSEGFALHVGVPEILVTGNTWKDIFSTEMILISLTNDGQPMIMDGKVIILIQNIITKMTK